MIEDRRKSLWPLPEPLPPEIESLWRKRQWLDLIELARGNPDDPRAACCAAIALLQIGRKWEAILDLGALASSGSIDTWTAFSRLELFLVDPLGADRANLLDEASVNQSSSAMLQARYLHARGLKAIHDLQWENSLRALSEAERLFVGLSSRAGAAQCADTLGTALLRSGRPDLALVAYTRALARKRLLNDDAGSALTLGNLGRCALVQGRWTEAIEYFESDLELLPLPHNQTLALQTWAAYAEIESGLPHAAACRLDEALTATAVKDLSAVPFTVIHLARALLRSDRPAQAKDILDKIASVDLATHTRLWRDLVLAQLANAEALQVISIADAAREHRLIDVELKARLWCLQRLNDLGGSAEDIRKHAQMGITRASESGYSGELEKFRAYVFASPAGMSVCDEGTDFSFSDIEGLDRRFLIREKLGGGSFATVFRAYDLRRQQDVALKLLQFEVSQTHEDVIKMVASLRNEIEVASRLDHPGLARVLGVGWADSHRVFLVQEWISGVTLREQMPWSESSSELLYALAVIADTLATLHASGIVHRDLKPENIMLRKRDRSPVLLDLGIAAIAKRLDRHEGYGTAPYAAPEQVRGDPTTEAADAYAFGVMLQELLPQSVKLREQWWQCLPRIHKALGVKPTLSLKNLVSALLESDVDRRLKNMKMVRKALIVLAQSNQP